MRLTQWPKLGPEGNIRLQTPVRWLLIAAILLVAGYLRFTGLNWDEGQWIHPDEGHMRMVTSAIKLPDRPALYGRVFLLQAARKKYVRVINTPRLFLKLHLCAPDL